MFITKNRKIFFSISVIFVLLSFFAIGFYGLNLGIDFTGGAITTVEYQSDKPEEVQIRAQIEALGLGNIIVQTAGDNGYFIRSRFLSEPERQSLESSLSFGEFEIDRGKYSYSAIGPTIGQELKDKALWAMLAVVLAIVLFIAYVFRKVSKPVSSWKYGLIAIVALIHDIIIPTGVFAILGYFYGVEINILFITALLAVLGYSVNDTIVVFDRVRENLKENYSHNNRKSFETVVGDSLSQTYTRSLNTSITTVLALSMLFFFGSSATTYFALALIIGIVAGTYSSICIAAPLLLVFARKKN